MQRLVIPYNFSSHVLIHETLLRCVSLCQLDLLKTDDIGLSLITRSGGFVLNLIDVGIRLGIPP